MKQKTTLYPYALGCLLFPFYLWATTEPLYLDALSFFHLGKYNEVLQKLDKVIIQAPQNIQALELKGLTLKSLGRYSEAVSTFSELVRSSSRSNGSHLFELATLQYHLRRYSEAQHYFKKSLEMGFNVGASHFFLGVIQFEEKRFEDSKSNFEAVLKTEVEDLRPSARLYLAQISQSVNDSGGVLRNFVAARQSASEQTNDLGLRPETRELARRVLKTADQELRSLDKSTLFAAVGTVSAYDSNVLSVPVSSASTEGARPGSFKQSLTYELGVSTSPVRSIQVLANYKGNINYNFNQETKSGQFFNHDLGVYFTKEPTAEENYGFKVAGSGILSYQTDATTSEGKFSPYSLAGVFGPYGKVSAGSNWTFGMEGTFSPIKNYLDDQTTEDLRRSGWETATRFYFSRSKPSPYWNPAVYVTGAYTRTTGTEYRSKKVGLDFGNTLYLSDTFLASSVLSASVIFFSERAIQIRTDEVLSLSLSAGKLLSRSISLLINAAYLKNFSNIDNFHYGRLTTLLALEYRI